MVIMISSKTYLMTGGTGFLGSELARCILNSGDKIIFIGKQKDGISYEERITSLYGTNNVYSIEMDLCDFNLEYVKERLENITKTLDGVWHLAANLSFKEEDREDVFTTNIKSIHSMMALCREYSTTLFYVSTAYVHGRTSGVTYEKFYDKPKCFNNPYEESKFKAEEILQHALGLKYIIFRPSILFDPRVRQVSNFGYYSFIIALTKLRKTLKLDPGKILRLPLPFMYYSKAFLNLMPIDIAIEWMIGISKKRKSVGMIFHICNPHPFLVGDIFEQTFRALKVRLILLKAPKFMAHFYFSILDITASIIKPLQPIAKRLYYFKWYLFDHVYYDLTNVRAIFGDDIDDRFIFEENYIYHLALRIEERVLQYKKT